MGTFLSRHEASRGAAAVEFALVAPLILFLLFAIVSYGYMLSFRQAISQAAAEGARAAAVAPRSFSDSQKQTLATNAVAQSIDSYGITCSSAGMACAVQLTGCPADTTGTKTCAVVEVDYAYADHPLLPRVLSIPMPGHLDYRAVAEVS